MRWKNKDFNRPKLGTTRTISKFLWLPICLNGECRWLEKTNIVQSFTTALKFQNIRWEKNEFTVVVSDEIVKLSKEEFF